MQPGGCISLEIHADLLLPSLDLAGDFRTLVGYHNPAETAQFTLILRRPIKGDPAFKVECQDTFSRDPFAIVFASNVNVGSSCVATFAGRDSNRVTLF